MVAGKKVGKTVVPGASIGEFNSGIGLRLVQNRDSDGDIGADEALPSFAALRKYYAVPGIWIL
jgi:hypothetical protein